MTSLCQDFLIKVVFEHILVRSDVCLECLTYVPPLPKNMLIPSPHLEKLSPSITIHPKKNNFIFRCSHCSCTIFILTSYSLYTQVMLILLLINVQYLQNAAFSLKNSRNGQIPPFFRFPTPNKKNQQNFPFL